MRGLRRLLVRLPLLQSSDVLRYSRYARTKRYGTAAACLSARAGRAWAYHGCQARPAPRPASFPTARRTGPPRPPRRRSPPEAPAAARHMRSGSAPRPTAPDKDQGSVRGGATAPRSWRAGSQSVQARAAALRATDAARARAWAALPHSAAPPSAHHHTRSSSCPARRTPAQYRAPAHAPAAVPVCSATVPWPSSCVQRAFLPPARAPLAQGALNVRPEQRHTRHCRCGQAVLGPPQAGTRPVPWQVAGAAAGALAGQSCCAAAHHMRLASPPRNMKL